MTPAKVSYLPRLAIYEIEPFSEKILVNPALLIKKV
jgi:hypothetical protein